MMRVVVLVSVTFLVTGCSYLGLGTVFRDRSDDYRRTEEVGHIQVPTDLDSDTVGELYPIPGGGEVVGYEIDSEFVVPRPRSVAINAAASEVRIQKLGEQIWILIVSSPGEAWSRVRSYLTRSGIPTARADLSRGVIETGLFELQDSPDVRHQFQISLSQGVQLNTTEVDILHREFAAADVPDPLPGWSAVSADLEREDWLRNSLSQSLAAENVTGAASLLGQKIGVSSKVELITPEQGLPYIHMRLSHLRAWASVRYALSRGGFEIRDDSEEQGVITADYTRPGQAGKRSWWRRMLFIGARTPEVKTYQVKLERAADATLVRVSELNGPTMTQRENFLVLQRIRVGLG